jgi:hypothetical protein
MAPWLWDQSNLDSDGDGHSLGFPWFDHRQRRQARWAKSNALPRHASLFIMVFRVHVLSRVDRSMSLSRLKELLPVPLSYALERGQTFDFLAQHKVSGVEFSDIEIELHKDRPMSFDIDASETVLSLAQFRTVRKL